MLAVCLPTLTSTATQFRRMTMIAPATVAMTEEEEILPPHELIQKYQEKRASLNTEIDRIFAEIESILGVEI